MTSCFFTNDKKDTPLAALCPSIVLTNTTNTFHNDFVNNFGADCSLSRELSMMPYTTIWLGCNKSFCHISLHWKRSAAACHPVLSHGRHSHDFGSYGSSSETSFSGSESYLSPTNLDENGLLGAVIFSHHNDAAHGSSPSLSMAAKGTVHGETILADGSVANIQVSAMILKKWASKHQWMDPLFPPADGDECKSMDEDWDDDDFSSLSTRSSSESRIF
jgi:hypothetical protein